MKKERWLVVGGNSDIAQAVCRALDGDQLESITLVSRDEQELVRRSQDLSSRLQTPVDYQVLDFLDEAAADTYFGSVELPDVVLIAAGDLMDSEDLAKRPEGLRTTLRVNYEALICAAEVLARRMVERSSGTIIALSSVAGLRGRPSNYVYGSTKAGLNTYLDGLRLRVAGNNVKVKTILCGMVDTKMTAGRDLPERLVATPDQVAKDVLKAYQGRRSVVYAPGFWRWIMLIIRNAPSFLVRRM